MITVTSAGTNSAKEKKILTWDIAPQTKGIGYAIPVTRILKIYFSGKLK